MKPSHFAACSAVQGDISGHRVRFVFIVFLESRERLQATPKHICPAPGSQTSCLGTSSLVNPCQCKTKPTLKPHEYIFFTRPGVSYRRKPTNIVNISVKAFYIWIYHKAQGGKPPYTCYHYIRRTVDKPASNGTVLRAFQIYFKHEESSSIIVNEKARLQQI